MNDTNPELPEFDRIVDEVLAGKRAFVFWPGTGSMVAIVMLHLFGLGAWLAPTFFAAVPWLRQQSESWPLVLPVGLAAIVAAITTPAWLIVQGKENGYRILRAVTMGSLALIALTALAVGWSTQEASWPYLLAGLCIAVAYRLEGSLSCQTYVTFRVRLRVRAEQRASETRRLLGNSSR